MTILIRTLIFNDDGNVWIVCLKNNAINSHECRVDFSKYMPKMLIPLVLSGNLCNFALKILFS